MRKISPIFFVTAFIATLIIAFHNNDFIQKVFAANLTATWKDAQTIILTGDFTGTLIAATPGDAVFRGQVTAGAVKCTLSVVVKDNTLTLPLPPKGASFDPPGTCNTPQFQTGQTFQLQGTKPGTKPKETQDQKKASISLESNKSPEDSPKEITFTIKDAKGKTVATRKVAKELKCQGFGCDEKPPTNYAYYGSDFFLDPGKYTICFSSIEPCHTETKKEFTPATWAYGEAWYFADINVGVGVSMLTQLGQSCKIAGYSFQLKKAGKIVQTIKTGEGEHKASEEEQNSLGGTNDIIIGLTGKFTNVKPGDYQVCLVEKSECKDVHKPQNGLTSPDPVHFDVKMDDSSKVCAAIGEEAGTPWPTQPPPPSPPCAKFNDKGGCDSIVTFFGNISTKPGEFITRVFAIILSVSGGIALFLIIRASYVIMTSRGKPEQLQQGRDQLIAAIVGLLFLIFSFVILEVIGTDILKLPVDNGAKTGTASAPVTHGVGGSCGQGAGANCEDGLTCDTTKDTSRECKRLRDCVGVCKR